MGASAGPVPLSLLLLADGRLPAGGHAHSAGTEAAVGDGRVGDLATLEDFTRGRLWSQGLVDAALAAATAAALAGGPSATLGVAGSPAPGAGHAAADGLGPSGHVGVGPILRCLDAEADARLAPSSLRAASRRLGRQLVRVADRCWPAAVLAEAVAVHPDGIHQAVATGVVGVAAGLDVSDVAALVAHHAVATPTQAAVKLLGLDPFAVAALAARLAGEAAAVAERAVVAAHGPMEDLPALTSPLVEVAAAEHHGWPVRLFAT